MTDQQSTPLSALRKAMQDHGWYVADVVTQDWIESSEWGPALIDAARERPSALDVKTLTGFLAAASIHEGLHDAFPSIRAKAEWIVEQWNDPESITHKRIRLARLTEPDAGEGTERHCICQVGGYTDICPIHPDPDAGEGTERQQFDPNLPSGARWVSGDE